MCIDESVVDEIILFNKKYGNPAVVQSLNESIDQKSFVFLNEFL